LLSEDVQFTGQDRAGNQCRCISKMRRDCASVWRMSFTKKFGTFFDCEFTVCHCYLKMCLSVTEHCGRDWEGITQQSHGEPGDYVDIGVWTRHPLGISWHLRCRRGHACGTREVWRLPVQQCHEHCSGRYVGRLCLQRFASYRFQLLVSWELVAFSALTLLVGVAGRASGLYKTEWWVAGMVICLEWGADLHTAQLMPLPLTVCCFIKIQIGFTFLVPAYPLNGCVCVCVSWELI